MPALVAPGPGISWLQWFTHLADVVVVATLHQQHAQLTPDGTEVRSALTFEVTEALTAPTESPLAVVDCFDWGTFGGAVTIDHVNVRARKPWSRDFREKATYLLFIKVAAPDDPLGGGRLVMSETSMFEVSDDHVITMVADLPMESITDRPFSAVRTDIMAATEHK